MSDQTTKHDDAAASAAKTKGRVEKSLAAIFQDEHGKIPDLQKLETRRRSRAIAWIIGIFLFVLLLLGVAWAGFFAFQPFQQHKGDALKISIDGPERIAIGEESTYFINWQNTSANALSSADIRVSFPADFQIFSSDPPQIDRSLTWPLGPVPFGGRGTLAIKGLFTGALGTKTALQAVGSYRLSSSQLSYETIMTKSVEYGESVLVGRIELPSKIIPGERVTIAATVENRGHYPFQHVEARFSLPLGFVSDAPPLLANGPSPSDVEGRMARFPIGTLGAGSATSVHITGTFAAGQAGETNFHAEAGTLGADNTFLSAVSMDGETLVLSGDLSVKLVVNGSDTDRSIGFGDALHAAISFENTAREPIADIAIRLLLLPLETSSTASAASAAPFIEWSAFGDAASGTVSGQNVSWTKAQNTLLENLPPGADGRLELTLPALRTPTSTAPAGFMAVVEATMQKVGESIVKRTVRTTPINFRYRTDADLAVEARYFSEEGAPLGTGPLPPVVGQTTRYRVFWDLHKTVHELQNLHVTAALPKRAVWAEKSTASAGDVVYDATARTVTWTLNRVPSDVDEASVTFDLDLTPSELDAARFADLLGETRFEATDADLGDAIARTKPAITTDLQNDEGAKSKGVVRKP